MSARDELFEALMPLYRAQYAPGEEDSTNALINAYARELAEKQRAEALRSTLILRVERPEDPYEIARAMAAHLTDLIDPEVSHDG